MNRTSGFAKRLTPQAVFLLTGGFFGLACALITPPAQAPDEQNHWYRTWQISEGHLLNVRERQPGKFVYGGQVPNSITDCCGTFAHLTFHRNIQTRPSVVLDEFHRPLNAAITSFANFPNTALYSPVPYIPAALGVYVGRSLSLPPIAVLLLGRMGNLLRFLLAGWLALRVTPILKWPVAVVLNSPMCLFLAGSLSADAMTIAMVFLSCAIILRGLLGTKLLSWRFAIALIACLSPVALCKSAYAAIAVMTVMIPPSRYRDRRTYWFAIAAVFSASIVSVLIWSALSHPQIAPLRGDSSRQLAWVMHHPFTFLQICAASLKLQFGALFNGSIGVLGWLDAPMPGPVIDLFFIALLWLTVAYGEPVKLKVLPRIVAAVAVYMTTLLICLAVYMIWTPVAAPNIDGLQGRYFLPLFLPGAMLLHRGHGYSVRPEWMAALLILFGVGTFWTLIDRYYLLI